MPHDQIPFLDKIKNLSFLTQWKQDPHFLRPALLSAKCRLVDENGPVLAINSLTSTIPTTNTIFTSTTLPMAVAHAYQLCNGHSNRTLVFHRKHKRLVIRIQYTTCGEEKAGGFRAEIFAEQNLDQSYRSPTTSALWYNRDSSAKPLQK